MARNGSGAGRSRRRTFLKRTSAVVTAGLVAGCAGGDGGDSGDGGSSGSGGSGGGSGGDGGSGGSGGDQTTTQKSTFPEKPITIIVPFGAGGGFDFYARVVAKYMSKNLGVQVKVQNVEGAGGISGGNQIYNADPDGYTLGIWYPPGMARAQIIRPDAVEYDMSKLTPFPSAAGTIRSLAMRTDLGQTTADYVEAVKNEEVTFGATGPVTLGRLLPVSVGRIGGAYDWEAILDDFVFFDGKGEWFTAYKRGDVNVMDGSYSSVLPFVQGADDLEMVLVFNQEDEPPSDTPDAQTLADTDLENPAQIMALLGSGPVYRVFVGPPDIPDDRKSILRESMLQALNSEELRAEATQADRPVNVTKSQKVGETLATYVQTWKDNQDLLDILKQNT